MQGLTHPADPNQDTHFYGNLILYTIIKGEQQWQKKETETQGAGSATDRLTIAVTARK
jgi:hypothetical protein